MRIALVTFNADPMRGGAERYTIELGVALRKLNHNVTILHHVALNSDTRTPNLVYSRLGRERGSRAARYESFINAVDERSALDGFDIIHAMLPVKRCDVYQPHAGFAVEALGNGKRRKGLSRILALIGNRLNRKRQLYAEIERHLLTPPTQPVVVCLSSAMREKAQSAAGIGLDRLVVIPNAVDLARYDKDLRPNAGAVLREEFGIGRDHKLALFVAQDFKRKGLAESLKAMAENDDPSLKLMVVGGDKQTPFRNLAKQLGILEKVIFAGAVADPYPFYAAADFVLFPSRSDPFGLVPAEAIAMGVPPIVSRQCGVSELLSDGHDALIIEDPRSVSQISTAIRTMSGPNKRSAMAEQCLHSRQLFSYEKHLDAVLQQYHHSSSDRGLGPIKLFA